MIQKQTWKDEIRILITDEENLSSVQIFIPLYVSDLFGKADALIYALFVDNNHRRKGVAQHLLQLAEQQAKLNGARVIGLEFVKAQVEGWKVKIKYHQVWGAKNVFKNRGESDYFVDDVIVLDKNFSKIGDIVKGTNKTAPHDTLYVKIVE